MAEDGIDPLVMALAREVLNGGGSKRAKAVITALLERGSMSTDDLAELGYSHPPRAVRDVKDAGVPISMRREVSKRTGRPMAVYSFGSAESIRARSQGGRRNFPKKFKQALLNAYGPHDRLSNARLDPKVLTIDHRVPYAVAGDTDELDVKEFMLLDGSSQRLKSWACEHCPNTDDDALDPDVCQTCYWAFPESYEHIATQQIRLTTIAWQGADVDVHDKLAERSRESGRSIDELLLDAARQMARTS